MNNISTALNTYQASAAQKRIWFQSNVASDLPLYNICIGYRLKGNLSQEAMDESLKVLLTKHEILRSIFKLEENELLYSILPLETYPSLTCINYAIEGEESISQAISHLLHQEAAHRFDFEQGPLFYAKLFQFSNEDNFLILSVHHIVSDEYSMGLFTTELAKFYNQYLKTSQVIFEKLTYDYHQYVKILNEKTKENLIEQRQDEFKTYFSQAEVTE